ncbi:MAG: enoyl-CoA hydratase/isomerase family protein [Deltaproteobacteria bacterium]|nr:enoyl-CoA hydratase/isomerase family protein [Deltaproteobacteria bacterium]
MASDFANILLSFRGRVGTITLNRPDRLNTLSLDTLNELRQAVEIFIKREDLLVGIITGAGEKAFCAGANVAELAKLNASQAKAFAEMGQEIFSLIENSGKPFIAAVNGYAFGGGCELALACPIRVASDNARFGQPEIKLGFTTGFGGSQRLVRLLGKSRATELCLFGEPIDAKAALDWGLVVKVVPQARLLEEANLFADKLASYPPLAVKFTLEVLNRASEASLSEGLTYEANLFGLSFATEDMKEGTAAFLEKRKAEFKGK